jgi:ribose-phosphate pyrophosphokinase
MTDWTIFGGPASGDLASAVARTLGLDIGAARFGRFPDGEVWVRLDQSVRNHDVVVIQSTVPPVNEHLFELLAITDSCLRGGANRITAVIPYFGYGRADTRHGRREALMARLVADLLQGAGVDHVLAVDAHRPQLEGYFGVPLDNLTAVPTLSDALRGRISPETVVVSPDLGGARLATAYGRNLGLATVLMVKQRRSGSDVTITSQIGEARGRPCLITDDMVTTGGTVMEAIQVLSEAGARMPVTVAATHGVLVGGAISNLVDAGVHDIMVTDSVAQPGVHTEPVQVVSIAPMLAAAIRCLMTGDPLTDLESKSTAS